MRRFVNTGNHSSGRRNRPRADTMRKTAEILLWILGTTLLAFYFSAGYWGEHQRRDGLASFAEAQELAPVESLRDAQSGAAVPARMPSVAQAEAEAEAAEDTVIAVLRIPGIALEVPVYQGTAEHVLRRGAGLVEGTAVPGSTGNVGIAAHRDTHFRGLQDVTIGDLIELGTLDQTLVYRITAMEVVDPGDVHVLDDAGEPMLTLVTCYPFHFVGRAPQRYIVRATAADASM
jgi:sortase A